MKFIQKLGNPCNSVPEIKKFFTIWEILSNLGFSQNQKLMVTSDQNLLCIQGENSNGDVFIKYITSDRHLLKVTSLSTPDDKLIISNIIKSNTIYSDGLNVDNFIKFIDEEVEQNYTYEQYEAALASINNHHSYYISTTINDTPYYLKSDGTITEIKSEASPLYFKKTSGAAYNYGFQIGEGNHFTNPSILSGQGINTTTEDHENWDSQVFFLNNEGKYAIRATNANGSSTNSQKPASYWNIVNDNAGYTDGAAFIWEIEDEGIIAEEGQLNLAVENITPTKRYRIHTSTDNYYITESGTLTDNVNEAGIFTFIPTQTQENLFVSAGKAFHLCFGDSYNSRFTVGNKGSHHINIISTNERNDLEAQVFYYNGENYAIRSGNFQSGFMESYWYVESDNDDNDELPQINYDSDNPSVHHFEWQLEEFYPFDHSQTYTIKCVNNIANASGKSFRYFKSPVYNIDNQGMNIYRTEDESKAAKLILTPVTSSSTSFYIYDTVSGYYVDKSNWTWSYNPVSVPITAKAEGINLGVLESTAFTLGTGSSSYANADQGTLYERGISNYSAGTDRGSYWYILPTGISTSVTFNTNEAYYIRTDIIGGAYNGYGYMQATSLDDNVLGRTNDRSQAGKYVFIPVNGMSDYYHIYEITTSKFITPAINTVDGTAWTLSSTPAPVKLIDNFEIIDSRHYYHLIGENNSHANAYKGGNGNTVSNYSNGSSWYLERLSIDIL